MNEIIQFPKTPTATFATTTVLVIGDLTLAPIEAPWPTQEQNFKITQDAPSFSNYASPYIPNSNLSIISQNFAAEIAKMFSVLSEDQEPFGSEFEAVWDANLNELYES